MQQLQRSLAKSRAKNEELSHIKHEMETVLVEQERQVTACEEEMKQMKVGHDNELELARHHDAEAQRVISSLRAECQTQQQRIDVLDGQVSQLKDGLEREKHAAAARDDSSRISIKDRDEMIAKLKALVRENQSKADAVKDELRKMNEEVKEKNRTIARLRQSCEELGKRCAELEAALCRTSLDTSHCPADLSLHSSGQFHNNVNSRPLSDQVVSSNSEASIEMRRHAEDYDEEIANPGRLRQMSATQVSVSADDSTLTSEASAFLQQPHRSAADGNLAKSDSRGSQQLLAGGDGFIVQEAEQTAAASYATRQQLLRQVCVSVLNLSILLTL